MRCSSAILVTLITLSASCAYSELADSSEQPEANPAVRHVPLEQVWAYRMPATKDIAELDDDESYGGLTEKIRRRLSKLSRVRNKVPRSCLVLAGTPEQAVEKAYELLSSDDDVSPESITGDRFYLFFFTHNVGSYVHLHEISMAKKTIAVTFVFQPHSTRNITTHYALIPLGKLHPGQYEVQISQVAPKGATPLKPEWVEQAICKSVKFQVSTIPTKTKEG